MSSTNGNVVDSDSFLLIFIDNSFSTKEICLLRRTCVWWRITLSSNILWNFLFQRDFVPSSSRMVTILRTSFNIQEFLHTESNNQEFFWFNYYLQVINQIPKPVPLPTSLEKQKEDANSNSVDGISLDEGFLSRDFSYLAFNHHSADYQIHKLSIILSLLGANGYLPKTHSHQVEFVRIGISSYWKRIPLLQFCYSVLCKEEGQLLELPKDVLNELFNELPSAELFDVLPEYQPDEKPNTSFKALPDNIGICLDVDHRFGAFVFYLKVQGKNIALTKTNEGTVVSNEYQWNTEEDGWTPAFFNAGYSWFYTAQFISKWEKDQKCIIVQKDMLREGAM